jgi:hypothetical protein
MIKNSSSFLNVQPETIKNDEGKNQNKSPRSRTVEAGRRRLKKNRFFENNDPNKT